MQDVAKFLTQGLMLKLVGSFSSYKFFKFKISCYPFGNSYITSNNKKKTCINIHAHQTIIVVSQSEQHLNNMAQKQ